MNEEKQQDNKVNYRKIAAGTLIIISALLLSLHHVQTNPTVTYRAYILQGQYIGDIQDHNTTYNDVLIMEVQPLIDTYGNLDLRDPEYKYGFHSRYNLNNPMSDFEPYGNPHRLYFANENRTLSDMQKNDIIVARWEDPFFGTNHIQGVLPIEQWG